MIENDFNELEQLEQLSKLLTEDELAQSIKRVYPNTSSITDASTDDFIAQFLPYIGGKYRQSNFIQANLPSCHLENYISVFGGMMWDFLRQDPYKYKIHQVVYNDVNQLNVNLFRCVINQGYNELYDMVKDIPNNEPDRFKEYQDEIYSPTFEIDSTPNFDIAMKYVYVLTNVFSGLAPATAKFIKGKAGFDTFKKKLDINNTRHANLRKNLDKISAVIKMDFADVISHYDANDTFLFVDPPYIGTEDYYSNSTFNYNDHIRLRESLTAITGKFQLCYYEDELLHRLYPASDYRWEKKGYVVGSSGIGKKM